MRYINKNVKNSPLLQQYTLVEKAVKKQEIWRQKQMDIFYRTGRPIFKENMYKYRFL
jgi:hypothetical protein|tara:strand:+ start:661 stop:831 length:171 start_codon:yes stop_codon:yes gene_type:complete